MLFWEEIVGMFLGGKFLNLATVVKVNKIIGTVKLSDIRLSDIQIYANLCKMYANCSLYMQICKNVFLKRIQNTFLGSWGLLNQVLRFFWRGVYNELFAYILHKFA